jgi:predicted AlkP superfamily pyrophosphatase or phosphodiesterase
MLAPMPGLLLTAALTLAMNSQPQQGSRIGINPPKLVVLISIDQFRGDYAERFWPYFLPARSGGKLGGFRFLMETGAHFRNAMHNHLPTATGPGHATLMSGSEPAYNGIVGNEWFDRVANKPVYCVDDKSVETVGGTSAPMSPRNLTVTTVGDELKMATNGKSKVVGVAIKDRASILMAGHAADTVIWYDSGTGNWVTSTWYAPLKQLPAWVSALNAEKPVDKFAGKVWEPLLPDDAYSITRMSPFEKPAANGKPFSHPMETSPGRPLNAGIIPASFGNEFTFQAATRAIDAEKLGLDDAPDILVVNLSSNDYVGHRYGPNSPEAMDMTVRTDRLLSDFLNTLQTKVPGGLDSVAIVITGDHGVVPIPEESDKVYKIGVKRGVEKAMIDAVTKALAAKFGEGKWILGTGLYEQNLYLNRPLAAEKNVKMEDLEKAAAAAALEVEGVFAAFTRTQIMNNGIPLYAWRERVMNGFHTKMGGDVMVLEAAGWYLGGGVGTGHGSVWDYDAHVPIIIRAKGIKAGNYLKQVQTSGIAPTVSRLLGIEVPSGNVGVPLVDSIEK